MQQLTSLLQIL